VTTIYLIRHCSYENPEKIVPFRLPGFPLSNEGKKEAKQITDYFKDKKIAAIYSSPLLRTKQTAGVIASELNLKVRLTPLLLETKTPFQGMKSGEFFRKYGFIFGEEAHLKGGGETIEKISTRMKKLINGILEKHSSQEVIVVSHGDPLTIYKTFLIEGRVQRGFWRVGNYIPMGGIFKLVFDEEGKLVSHARVNY